MYSTNSIQISYDEESKKPTTALDYTVDDKDLFRLSINSSNTTSTAGSSNRFSYMSNSDEEYITYCTLQNDSSTSLTPSRHGLSTSDSLRNKILSKFYHPQKNQKAFPEAFISTVSSLSLKSDSTTQQIDPWGMTVKLALDSAIFFDWAQKYEQPTFSFTKVWKKRYCILVDRVLFVFKHEKAATPTKDYFVLTQDTLVFATEEFKKGYVIEVRNSTDRWFIRCDSVDRMKYWINYMKKIVACIKIGYSGTLNSNILDSITLTDDYRILIPTKLTTTGNKKQFRQSFPPSKRQSLQDIPNWQSRLPPQLPPPKTKPPPVPLIYKTKNLSPVSEDI